MLISSVHLCTSTRHQVPALNRTFVSVMFKFWLYCESEAVISKYLIETVFPTSSNVMFRVHQDNAGTLQKPQRSLSAVLTAVPMLLWGSTFSGSRQRDVVLLFSAFPKTRSTDNQRHTFTGVTRQRMELSQLVWFGSGVTGASCRPDSTKEWQESTIWSSIIGKSATISMVTTDKPKPNLTAFMFSHEKQQQKTIELF